MSIGSRRTREKEETITKENSIIKVEKKETVKEVIIPKKEDIRPIVEVIKEILPESIVVEVKPVKEIIKEEKAPVVIQKVELEKIEKVPIKVTKKREDIKEPNLVGIVGKTVVANDFRAICKKQGKQINVVLTELLHGWNMANYNL